MKKSENTVKTKSIHSLSYETKTTLQYMFLSLYDFNQMIMFMLRVCCYCIGKKNNIKKIKHNKLN